MWSERRIDSTRPPAILCRTARVLYAKCGCYRGRWVPRFRPGRAGLVAGAANDIKFQQLYYTTPDSWWRRSFRCWGKCRCDGSPQSFIPGTGLLFPIRARGRCSRGMKLASSTRGTTATVKARSIFRRVRLERLGTDHAARAVDAGCGTNCREGDARIAVRRVGCRSAGRPGTNETGILRRILYTGSGRALRSTRLPTRVARSSSWWDAHPEATRLPQLRRGGITCQPQSAARSSGQGLVLCRLRDAADRRRLVHGVVRFEYGIRSEV